MKLYGEFAHTYRLLTPPSGYEEEAGVYQALMRSVIGPERARLLELGAGAGHNASWFQGFDLTLTDLSPRMVALAAELVPEARCLVGDMRTLRLGELFDAVFVHDALSYLRTVEELRQVADTVVAHLRPGGVALCTPDYTRETFEPSTDCGGSDGAGESVRYLEWVWQRAGQEDGYVADYVVVHRVGDGPAQIHHDRHDEGLFPAATWREVLTQAGLELLPAEDPGLGVVVFLGRRPG